MATYNQPNRATGGLAEGVGDDTDELLDGLADDGGDGGDGSDGGDLTASSPQGQPEAIDNPAPAPPGPTPPKSAKTRRRKTRDVVMNVHVYLNDREAMMARRLQKVYDVPYTIMFRMWLREQYALTFKADIVRESVPIVPGVNDE